MHELQLSTDLNIITAEINSYKQVASQSIFEIGRRLKHVKDNDLVHGEWEGYCVETLDMTPAYANRYIKVFDEFGDSNQYPGIGLKKMYQIATMPEDDRAAEHTVPSTGERKTVDEMTSRELEEVKRQLKIVQEEAKQAKHSEKILARQLEIQYEKAENANPEVVEIVKEVIPADLQREIDEKDRSLQKMQKDMERQREELRMLKNTAKADQTEEAREKELKYLNYEANKTTLTLKLQIDDFLKEAAITAFRRGAIAASSESTKQKLQQGIEELQGFCEAMEATLNDRIILKGGEMND